MQCVVLAGGLATRMRPKTEKVPKVLLEVAGRPFLARALTWWAEQGVSEVVLSVGFLAEQVEAFLAAHPPPLRVTLVKEPEPLGTAGALRLCEERGALAERFLLTWGDSFLPVDFGAVGRDFEASGASALMTVLENRGQWDQSNVVFEGGRLVLYDKSRTGAAAERFTHVDYGLMGLTRALVASRVPQRGDLAPLFSQLAREGALRGFPVRRRFYEVGSPQGLADLEAFVTGAPLVVLDRDGVLNRTLPRPGEPRPDSPLGPEEVELLPGVPEALAELDALGARVAIASNQPAAAKGKTTRERLEAAHAKVLALAQAKGGVIASSHLCFHRAEDGCACRKPKPKLLLDALAASPGATAERAFMVGDREVDAEAGRAAGFCTVLLAGAGGEADFHRGDLPGFVRLLRALRGG
jgi:MurNAc alpha-1-phosphate uridylyltransferase